MWMKQQAGVLVRKNRNTGNWAGWGKLVRGKKNGRKKHNYMSI